MSSAKERLEKARGNSFLVGLAAGARTPKQLDKAVENLREQSIELTEEERKQAREIAKKKRDDKKTFKAILSEVLEKERFKESKMTKTRLTEKQREILEVLRSLPKGELRKLIKGSRKRRKFTGLSGTLSVLGGAGIVVAVTLIGCTLVEPIARIQTTWGLYLQPLTLLSAAGVGLALMFGYIRLLERYFKFK